MTPAPPLVALQDGAGAASLAGSDAPILVSALDYSPLLAVPIVAVYLLLHLTSGRVVAAALRYGGVAAPVDGKDTGTAIGKIENVLVLTLMVLQAYTALGVVFAAKSIVRADDMDTGDTSYYLTGTIANFTYSIVVGVCLHLGLRYAIRMDVLGAL